MLQQRRPRLHTLDVLGGSANHETSDNNNTSGLAVHTDQFDPYKDDDTPRHRKRPSMRALWANRHRRAMLIKYAAIVASLCLIVILTVTRTLGIRIFPKKLKNAAAFRNAKGDDVYPPSTVQISAIVMNYARPNLLQHSTLLSVLVDHPTVDEILILHANPHTAFGEDQLQHLEPAAAAAAAARKIVHVDASEPNTRMGLAVRFYYCATLARHEWVLHVDDDMELDATTVNALVHAFMANPRRIVGHYGRSYNYWSAPFRHGYGTKDVFGEHVEVVLTKLMLLERAVCSEFERQRPLMQDMIADSHPLWNGEDIFANLVANQYYGVPYSGPYNNYAMSDLHVWEADTDLYPELVDQSATTGSTTEVSISGNMDRNRIWNVGPVTFWKAYFKAQEHTVYRGKLWYTAKRRLAGFKD
jgi:Glycosyl transferase family 64 domain